MVKNLRLENYRYHQEWVSKLNDEFKIYRLSKIFPILGILIFFGWFFLGYDKYLFHDKEKLSVWLVDILFGFAFMTLIIYPYYKPPIITWEDKIIIRQYFFLKPKIIETNKIISIERKSLTHIMIHYINQDNKKKKQRIRYIGLQGNDQIEFNKYIENVIDRMNSPFASN